MRFTPVVVRCGQETDLPPRDALTTRRDYTGVEGESIVKVLERRGSMGMSMAMTFGAGVRFKTSLNEAQT